MVIHDNHVSLYVSHVESTGGPRDQIKPPVVVLLKFMRMDNGYWLLIIPKLVKSTLYTDNTWLTCCLLYEDSLWSWLTFTFTRRTCSKPDSLGSCLVRNELCMYGWIFNVPHLTFWKKKMYLKTLWEGFF